MRKYRNIKVVNAEGIQFDSKREMARYTQLVLLQRAGMICNLQRQVKFVVIPKVNRVKRTRFYIADFVYEEGGKKIIEDVKSPITKQNPAYTLKRDLLLWQYPDYEFRETM